MGWGGGVGGGAIESSSEAESELLPVQFANRVGQQQCEVVPVSLPCTALQLASRINSRYFVRQFAIYL